MTASAHPGHRGGYGVAGLPGDVPIGRRPSHGFGFRVLRLAGGCLGLLLLFVLALVAGAIVHLDTPRARRLVEEKVNAILAPSFQGRIRIERIGGLGLGGLSRADVTIEDPGGRPVLAVRGTSVSVATLAAAGSALFGRRGPLVVRLTDVSVDDVDVRLDADPAGHLLLLDALAPTKPAAPPDPNARGLRLVVSRAALKHAHAHGRMPGAPPLEVTLDGLRGSLTFAPDVLEADVARAEIAARRILNGADVVGVLGAHVRKPSDPHANIGARLDWEGTAGGLAHVVRASLQDQRVDAVVDVPRLDRQSLRGLWPGARIDEAGAAHLEAHGTLPQVDVGLRARLGAASLDASGSVYAGEDAKRVTLSLAARNIDLRELAAGAPRSRLGLTAEVDAEDRADGALRADAQVVVKEPAAPTSLTVHIVPAGRSSLARFALRSSAPDLARVPELQGAVHGAFDLATTGTVDLAARTLDANLRAHATGIARGSTRVDAASIDARAAGALASPILDVSARARGVDAGGVHLVSAEVRATGAAREPHVEASARGPDTPDIDASADVALAGSPSLGGLRVALARAGERALLTARRIATGRGDLRVEDLRIEGAGAPAAADLSLTKDRLRMRASSRGLDLARIGRLAHLEKRLAGGIVSFDADMDLRRDGGHAKVVLDVDHARVVDVSSMTGHLDAALDGRVLTGTLRANAGDIGSLDLDVKKIALARGGPLTAASWRNAFGFVGVQARADLARLAAVVPPEDFPLSEARGEVILDGHVGRDDLDDVTPDIVLAVTTHRLAIAPKTLATRDIDGVLVMPRPRWHLEDIDFDVNARVDGDSGALQLSTRARDAKGPIAQLDAAVPHPPCADLLRDTGRLRSAIRTTDFDVRLIVPERGLGTMPPLLRQSYASGRITAALHAAGTLLTPNVEVGATLRRSRLALGSLPQPLDVDLTARYDGKRGRMFLKATSGGRELADADAEGDAPVADLLGGGGAPRWDASARVHLDGFPLESIAVLDDKQVAGRIRGDVTLAGLHRDGRLQANLDFDGLRVGSFDYKSAHVNARADGRAVDATVRIDQADGFLETTAHAPATWGPAVAPTLDPTQPVAATVAAKNFRIGVLLPFVDSFLDELDGRIDADARVELDPRSRAARLAGNLGLRRGTIEAVAGGGEFHDIAANVKFTPDGVVTLERLSAAGLSGHLEATASARLNGVALESATGTILIPRSSPVPLTGGGSELGNVDGRIVVTERTAPGGKAMDVRVDVPELHVSLPEASTGNAQALGPIPKARVGSHRGTPRTFVLLPLDPVKKREEPDGGGGAQLAMTTHLGDVEVVRGTQLKVDLAGQVSVRSGTATDVEGQIHLKPGGQLAVQGKNFTVESGTVTFVGDDPSNPQVVVKAGWKAPDGTTVYANFVGPLKTGKVTLSSEPPLPQQEIVQLILFGTASGKQAQSPQANTETSAIGTVGGEAAQPLNHALRELGLGAVTASVDTSQSANPKPEVEVQIAKDISIQLAVVLGQPPPGVNPDRTLLTLDWRFLSRWSLASTLGDAGTAIFDVLWQKRY